MTAGTVTYPNTHRSTAGDVLTINSSGTASWAASSSSSGVPYTGASQAVNLGGYDLTVNGLTIGTGKVGGAGTLNTIVGEYALNRANTFRGTDNTAIGHKAMGNETASSTSAGTKNTAVGSWTLVSSTGTENSAVGVGAMQQNSSGGQNTGIGNMALNINSTGSNNTAIGYAADVLTNNLSNATAIGNGAKVAASNTIQLGNTSVTNVNTSGSVTANGVYIGRGAGNDGANVAVGGGTLGSGTGTRNTAIGYASLNKYSGTSFDGNTSVGYYNLVNLTSGQGNTSVGAEAMMGVVNGSDNTSLGVFSLMGTNGNDNVGVGVRAGQSITTGSQNTLIGKSADVGTNNLSNATALGYGATVAASNTIQLGNASVTDVKTSGTVTAASHITPSDLRLKSNVVPLSDGLSSIMQLNPVHYTKKTSLEAMAYSLEENGFIAQEIQKILPFIVKEGDGIDKLLSVDYTSLIALLTKAIQEQQQQIQTQQEKIEELQSYKSSISSLQKELEEIKKLLKGQEK